MLQALIWVAAIQKHLAFYSMQDEHAASAASGKQLGSDISALAQAGAPPARPPTNVRLPRLPLPPTSARPRRPPRHAFAPLVGRCGHHGGAASHTQRREVR